MSRETGSGIRLWGEAVGKAWCPDHLVRGQKKGCPQDTVLGGPVTADEPVSAGTLCWRGRKGQVWGACGEPANHMLTGRPHWGVGEPESDSSASPQGAGWAPVPPNSPVCSPGRRLTACRSECCSSLSDGAAGAPAGTGFPPGCEGRSSLSPRRCNPGRAGPSHKFSAYEKNNKPYHIRSAQTPLNRYRSVPARTR